MRKAAKWIFKADEGLCGRLCIMLDTGEEIDVCAGVMAVGFHIEPLNTIAKITVKAELSGDINGTFIK